MPKKYPDWAPQAVINFHEEKTDSAPESYYKFCESLLNHPSMKTVWKTLIKRNTKGNDVNDAALIGFFVFVIFFYVQSYALSRDIKCEVMWDKMTTAKRKKLKSKIEGLIVELSECMQLVPSTMLGDIVEFLPEDVVFDLAVRLDKNIKELYSKGDQIPGMARYIIKGFLKSLKKVSENIDPEFGLLKRPERVDSDQLLFIRKLGIYLIQTYGTFLNEVNANTASVVFDNPDIDEDVVRFAVKGIDMEKVNKYKHYL